MAENVQQTEPRLNHRGRHTLEKLGSLMLLMEEGTTLKDGGGQMWFPAHDWTQEVIRDEYGLHIHRREDHPSGDRGGDISDTRVSLSPESNLESASFRATYAAGPLDGEAVLNKRRGRAPLQKALQVAELALETTDR